MKTRAVVFLTKKKTPFEIIEYDHREKGAEYAAEAISWPLERTVKTLVIDLKPNGYAFALLPGDKHLSVKKMAAACEVKKAAMANVETAQRITGYWVGGISPFGAARKIPAFMEKSLLMFDKVAINAGQRGVMLMMNPKDILDAAEAKSVDLIA